ncbi:MAG: ATP-binding protein, partial [Anaerolineae bacterium]|nr:ATP-binding protein [Anaerolineae bacterium]
LQTGKLTLNQRTLDLQKVVRQTVATAEPLLNGPQIHIAASPTPLPIQGDDLRLRQVVLNLLTNAATYAHESDRVDVRLRRVDQQAELQIQDYGPGIPANALPHLFSRYYQVSQPNHSEGLGLGLYIVNQLVTAHRGTIAVQSAEGQGTTFTLRFPLRPD